MQSISVYIYHLDVPWVNNTMVEGITILEYVQDDFTIYGSDSQVVLAKVILCRRRLYMTCMFCCW